MIIITGGNGQLAKCFKKIFKGNDDVIFLSKDNCDITNPEELKSALKKYSPNYIINCAAYTAVDRAESDEKNAFKVNSLATKLMGTTCKELNIKIFHISTDYVFDGKSCRPYIETDPTNPLSVYGKSKCEGEKLLLQSDAQSMIIRTSWLYSEFNSNFVKNMRQHLLNGRDLKVVADQVGSPTYAMGLAEMIKKIIEDNLFQKGIYHYCDSGVASWYDLTMEIAVFLNLSNTIEPIVTADYPTPASRPQYSALDNHKIFNLSGLSQKWWKTQLFSALKVMQD